MKQWTSAVRKDCIIESKKDPLDELYPENLY